MVFRDLLASCALGVCLAVPAAADSVSVYVDSAPNAYGSPDFAPWRASAFQKASDGTFINMEGDAFAGTTKFAATDALVYSYGDLGSRLHFVYFVDGVTKADLADNLEVRMSYDWDGVTYYDFGAGGSFVTPNFANLVEINGGVAGTFGDAFWPVAGDAEPTNVFDAADIASVASVMYQYQTFWKGEVRVREGENSAWQEVSLTAALADPSAVPLPATAWTGMVLMGAIGGYRGLRRRRRAE